MTASIQVVMLEMLLQLCSYIVYYDIICVIIVNNIMLLFLMCLFYTLNHR